jgi:nucleotide-binding universal stress UspA family protein
MTIRTVLAEVTGNAADEAVLDTALQVADRHAAHISVLHVKRDQIDPTWDAGMVDYGPIIDIIQQEAKKREAAARRRFEDWRKRHRLAEKAEPPPGKRPTVAFQAESGIARNRLTEAGRVADLTLMLRPEIAPADTSADFETFLFETGRPVLLVPAKGDGKLYQHIMVAWDGSLEAARAVALAMPFLEEAEKVSVYTGGDQPSARSGKPAADLVKHLAWHDIKAGIAAANPKADSVGADLLDSCRKAKASLLVMGAYTHSRLREVVLGGVTRHVLANAKLPLLMTH